MEAGASVVITKTDGSHKRLIQLVAGKLLLIEKLKFFPDNAIGHEFGAVFKVKNRKLETNENDESMQNNESLKKDESSANGDLNSVKEEIKEEEREDESSHQKISQSGVEALRSAGTSGKNIVERLVHGSTTYGDKTQFAKDKYVTRKTRKHGDEIVFLKPTLQLLCEVYYAKDPEKIANLRLDLLSQVLNLAHVHFGSQVIVFEQCQGLISGGTLDRLSTSGACIHLHAGVQAQAIPVVYALNARENTGQTPTHFYPVPLGLFFGEPTDVNDKFYDLFLDGNKSWRERTLIESGKITKAEIDLRNARKEKVQKGYEMLLAKNSTALILASKNVHPLPLLKYFIDYIQPSSPIVIYCSEIDPLVQCYHYLKHSEQAVNINLHEEFYRKYQVLPNRTHPEMTQMISGGYLMSAYKVTNG